MDARTTWMGLRVFRDFSREISMMGIPFLDGNTTCFLRSELAGLNACCAGG